MDGRPSVEAQSSSSAIMASHVQRRTRRTSRNANDLRQIRLVDGSTEIDGATVTRKKPLVPFTLLLLLGAIATVGVALWLRERWLGVTFANDVDTTTEGAAAFLAALCCFVTARRATARRARLSWATIGVGSLSWAVGEGAWCYYTYAGSQIPFPSLADVGFLLAIVLLTLGVVIFPVETATTLSRVRVVLDGVIVAASFASISWIGFLNTYFSTTHETTAKVVISLVYPLADLAVATIALSALARSGRQRRVPLLLIVAGMLALAVSDSAFFYFESTRVASTINTSFDVGWIGGFFLVGLAALWPQPSRAVAKSQHRVSLWQTVIPYVLLLGAVAIDVVEYASHKTLDGFLVIDGLVLVSVVLVRQVLIVLENHELTSSLEAAIETLRAEESELSRLALHDPLTGLANRLLFTERLDAALALAEAGQRRVAVVFCDLDGFKDANDSLGHSAGDAMLKGVAERLLACVRPEDTVARLGGDEFAIVLEDLDDLSDASRVAARIVETMREPLTTSTERFLLHVSIGIALASEGSYGIEELLRDADIALYAAKNAGGNRYRMFDSTMGTAYLDRLRLEADLGIALERDELFLEYQPIIDLSTSATIGVEALLRWRHPTRGLLQPAAFLGTAERSGSIVSIGKWVLEESLSQLRAWQSELVLPQGFSIAVNLSVRQLEAGDLISSVEQAIANSGVDPRAVRLELTETALIDRAEASIDLLHALRRLGVHLEIDDFGTGYSSLDYLRRLPLDILKIDQSFITGLGTDPHDTLIVETIVNLAHALGMTVVAEGVETTLQLARLRSLGCDFGQGFFWSRSLGAGALAAWMEDPAHAGGEMVSDGNRSGVRGGFPRLP